MKVALNNVIKYIHIPRCFINPVFGKNSNKFRNIFWHDLYLKLLKNTNHKQEKKTIFTKKQILPYMKMDVKVFFYLRR